MATVTQRRPRVKPARTIRLAVGPCDGNPGVVEITVGKATASYYLSPIPADFGAAFEVVKIGPDGETYHVNLDGGRSSCDCKGFTRWGRCKHRDGLAALRSAGRL